MRFYNFHIGDYTSHTRGLKPLEDLAYRRLIDEYFLHEKAPSGTPESIADDIGLAEYVPEVTRVLRKFFVQDGDSWVHERIEADLEEMTARAESARQNGKRGGRPRKGKETDSVSTETEPLTTHNPLPITPHTPRGADDEQPTKAVRQSKGAETARVAERFAKFWHTYPRKVGKDSALKAWMKLSPDDELMETILASLAAHIRSRDWQKDDGQFIPHASTWLNGKRWEDEVAVGAGADDPFEGIV